MSLAELCAMIDVTRQSHECVRASKRRDRSRAVLMLLAIDLMIIGLPCPAHYVALVVAKATSRPQAQVSVLDSLTLEWRQPKIEGTPIGVRTRHTAVAVHADYEEHERGKRRPRKFRFILVKSISYLSTFFNGFFRRVFKAPVGRAVVCRDRYFFYRSGGLKTEE